MWAQKTSRSSNPIVLCLLPKSPSWVLPSSKFEEGKGVLGGLGDEPCKCSNTPYQKPHILNCLRCLNLLNNLDLIGVGLYPTVGHKEAK